MSDDYRMRKCGEGWEYCNGKCSECPKTHIVVTNYTKGSHKNENRRKCLY